MDIFHIDAMVSCSTFQQSKQVFWSIRSLWPFQLECSSCTQGPIYWLIYVCYNLSIESVNEFDILMLQLYMILMILQPSDMYLPNSIWNQMNYTISDNSNYKSQGCLRHCRADSRLVPSQWETALQSNAVSHWLGTNLELALHCKVWQ